MADPVSEAPLRNEKALVERARRRLRTARQLITDEFGSAALPNVPLVIATARLLVEIELESAFSEQTQMLKDGP